jgi:hypothetical protein
MRGCCKVLRHQGAHRPANRRGRRPPPSDSRSAKRERSATRASPSAGRASAAAAACDTRAAIHSEVTPPPSASAAFRAATVTTGKPGSCHSPPAAPGRSATLRRRAQVDPNPPVLPQRSRPSRTSRELRAEASSITASRLAAPAASGDGDRRGVRRVQAGLRPAADPRPARELSRLNDC